MVVRPRRVVARASPDRPKLEDMPLSSVPSTASVVRELERVVASLDKGNVRGAARLELLRRQAALGDLRDAISERARRASAS